MKLFPLKSQGLENRCGLPSINQELYTKNLTKHICTHKTRPLTIQLQMMMKLTNTRLEPHFSHELHKHAMAKNAHSLCFLSPKRPPRVPQNGQRRVPNTEHWLCEKGSSPVPGTGVKKQCKRRQLIPSFPVTSSSKTK